MRMEEVGGITPRLDSTSDQLHLYVPIHGTQGLDSNPSWSVNLFADNAYTGTTTLEGGYWITRFDGIAESSDPVLSDYAATNDYVLTGGRLTFYGRRSMGAAVTSQWALVEGSAVVTYVSGPNSGALTPGVAVAGDGIPAGTFVRRIIDTAHLQLSLPATATGAAVALSFSPLASSCYQMIQSIENLHGNGTIMVNKNGADLLRVDVGQLRGTANMLQRVSTGQTSGVLALHDARAYSGIFSLQDAWLELPMSGETHPVLSNVTVLTTSTLDVPDAGAVAEISTLAGNGARLVKQGAGRLSAGIGFESALDLEIAQGSVALPRPAAERLLSEAALWLDASRADTLTFDTEGRISRWADANGLAKGATNAVTARQPTRVENALNGLPVVDFGPYQTSGSGGGLFLETREAAVRSAFIVYDGRHTDAVMLGEASRDYSSSYTRSANTSNTVWSLNTAAAVKSGRTTLDGVTVDGTATELPLETFHTVSVVTTGNTGAGSLGSDRDYRSGGQRIAEVILFNRPLSPDEQSTLDAYLMKKWFGEALPRQIGNLSLADGTRLVLPDEETLIVKHLTATGDVWLEGPGQLLVTGGLTQAGTVHVVHGGGVAAAGLGGSLAAPQPRVAENPAFWVDACTLTNAPAPDVVEEGGSYYVTRWADVRGTGYPFATNVTLRPTLRLNDINGLPSVKFTRTANVVPAQSEALFWDQPLKEIRAVFVVIGSQEGGGILLGSSAAENTLDFYRGAWVDPARSIFNASGSGAAAELINGPVYLNGLPVDPLVAGYNGFFQLVEAFPTGPVQASAFAADRNVVSGNGCQRLCEVILYTRELSEAEQMDTAEYLMRKWFGRSTPRAGAVTTLDALAADGATTVDLASTNDYLAVTRCTGSGPFIKRGAGTLVLKSVGLSGQPLDVQDGTLILKAGDPADNIPADAFLHVDASQPDTLEFDPAEGAFAVERWLDCRNGPHFARVRTTAWRPHPVLEEQALNGLPVIDFGTLMTGGPTTPQQCFFEWDQPCSNVWDAFLVVGSAAGGNVMLGNKVSSLRHFRRSVSSDYTRPVLDGNASTLLRMGETRLNGQVVNPSSAAAGLSGTYDLISFSAFGGGVYADAFAIDAYVSTAGQQLGEVLVYDRPLTYQQRLDIEAYLLKKWFNTDSPGYEPSAVGTLAVADSAHVEIDGVLSLDGLSGAGTISGDLDLSLGAVLTVSVAAGSTSGLTVNGTVTAAGSGTVVLTGDVPGLLPGIHTVFSCTSLSGAEGWPESWSVIGVPAKYAARLVSDGAVLYLRLSAKGSLLKVK